MGWWFIAGVSCQLSFCVPAPFSFCYHFEMPTPTVGRWHTKKCRNVILNRMWKILPNICSIDKMGKRGSRDHHNVYFGMLAHTAADCLSGCIWNAACLCWHGEPESVNQLLSCTKVSQDAVLFWDHVVVSVDGPLTVRLMPSPGGITVCYVSLSLVKIISVWPFCVLHVNMNAAKGFRACVSL